LIKLSVRVKDVPVILGHQIHVYILEHHSYIQNYRICMICIYITNVQLSKRMQRSCVLLYELFLHWPRCINKVDNRHRALYQ